MKLSDVVQTEGASLMTDPIITGVSFDSRDVRPGHLFVALVGAASDGHDYTTTAIENGAVALVVERTVEVPASFPVVHVSDSRAELGRISESFYRSPSKELRVVGLTGTNGKTTTTFLLETMLRGLERSTGVIGTINYRYAGTVIPARNTTPENATLMKLLRDMQNADVSDVLMEVSSHGLATHRVNSTYFDVMAFTNFSQDHLDFHGSEDAYFSAKALLFSEHVDIARRNGKKPIVVLNRSSHVFEKLAAVVPSDCRVITYGMGEGDISGVIGSVSPAGSWLTITLESGTTLAVELPLLGVHNAENALCAVACVVALGEDPTLAVAHLADVVVPGRLSRVASDKTSVFIDYAHSPDALEHALVTLRTVTEGRLIVVFGCGGDRDQSKRPIMGSIAETCADVVIVTSDNPRTENPVTIIDDVVKGIRNPESVVVDVDRANAIEQALKIATQKDVVLIAGKGHETYQELADGTIEFSDFDVATKVLDEMR